MIPFNGQGLFYPQKLINHKTATSLSSVCFNHALQPPLSIVAIVSYSKKCVLFPNAPWQNERKGIPHLVT